jgi:hypothetical protein
MKFIVPDLQLGLQRPLIGHLVKKIQAGILAHWEFKELQKKNSEEQQNKATSPKSKDFTQCKQPT